MSASKPKVLVVLTSADKVPKSGKQIGWYLPELAHPFEILNHSVELVYASPKGGVSPLDPVSVEIFKDDPVCKNFLENHQSVWHNTAKLSDFAGRASEFDAIFFPGGHGPMVDLVDDQDSKGLIRDFHAQDKVISAVCHGPAALVNATTVTGEPLLKGVRVTGFDNVGEEMFQFTEDMDFSLEDRLGEISGGNYVKAADGPLGEMVVVDGKIITGQNPASSKRVGEAIAKILGVEIETLKLRVKELEAQLQASNIESERPDKTDIQTSTESSTPNSPLHYNDHGIHLDTHAVKSSSSRAQFYGPSSTYYFIHRINAHLQTPGQPSSKQESPHALIPNSASRSFGHAICPPGGETNGVSDSKPTDTSALASERQQQLTEYTLSGKGLTSTQEAFFLELFWDSWHCCYQVQDEVEFKVHYKSLWSEPSSSSSTRKPSALVDIVLALCMQFGVTSLPRQVESRAQIDIRDATIAGRWLYQRCQILLAHELETPSLTTLQCQFWSAVYLGNASFQNMAQSMLGAAVRTAHALGLHVEPPVDLPPAQREARNRMWWTLFVFETRVCIRLGRPWGTCMAQMTCSLPAEDHADGVSWITYTVQRTRLMQAARQAFDTLYTRYASTAHSQVQTLEACSKGIKASLEQMRAWVKQLPDAIKTERRGNGEPYSTDLSEIEIEHFAPLWLRRQRLMLELQYHDLVLTLCRSCIAFSLMPAGTSTLSPHCPCHDSLLPMPPTVLRVAESAVLHAISTTHLLRQIYNEYDILDGWYEPFNYQWNAAITLVGFILAHHKDSAVIPAASEALTMSINVLERMGSFFGVAASAAVVIRGLLNKATLAQRLELEPKEMTQVDNQQLADITETCTQQDSFSLCELEGVGPSYFLPGTVGTLGPASEFGELFGFSHDGNSLPWTDDSANLELWSYPFN
ncbi:hypothetical protein ACJZ2D_000050 [Fusarium nematophilum]